MSDLQMIVTDAGRAALVNAANNGTAAVTVASVGFSAQSFAYGPATTGLPGEIKRIPTISGDVVADDTIHIIVRDDANAVYSVRSFALYLSDGTLFAIYSQAGIIIEKSAMALLLLAIDVRLANIAASQITFGNANFLNPPATVTTPGVVELATEAEAAAGLDTTRAVTPAGVARALLRVTLAYIPVRQSGTNGVAIGWAGTRLRAEVDATDLGYFVFDRHVADVWRATNDGAGSGLDADLLDGREGGWYADIAARQGYTSVRQGGGAGQLGNAVLIGWNNAGLKAQVDATDLGFFVFDRNIADIWRASNDGAGSGLDADLLDGREGGWYADIAARQGYTSVRQGGGAGQLGNAVLIGWNNTGLKAQVDANDLGFFVFDRHVADVWRASNDGAGSGLDADLLDGQQGAWYTDIAGRLGFAPANRAGDTFGQLDVDNGTGGHVRLAPTGDIMIWRNGGATAALYFGSAGNRYLYYDGSTYQLAGADLVIAGNRAWHAGNDGAGSGADADLLDGQHGAWYTDIAARLGFTPANRAGDTFGGRVSATDFGLTASSCRIYGTAQGMGIYDDGRARAVAYYVGEANSFNIDTASIRRGGASVWDSANDGAGSGLDADLLDGRQASEFALLSAFVFGANAGQMSQRFPNGLIFKAGHAIVTDSSGISRVTFNEPFPTACLRVVACNDSGGAIPSAWAGAGNADRNGVTIGHAVASLTAATSGTAAHWMAIGY